MTQKNFATTAKNFKKATKNYLYTIGMYQGNVDRLACTVKPTDEADRNAPAEGEEKGNSMLYIFPLK